MVEPNAASQSSRKSRCVSAPATRPAQDRGASDTGSGDDATGVDKTVHSNRRPRVQPSFGGWLPIDVATMANFDDDDAISILNLVQDSVVPLSKAVLIVA